MLKAHGWLEKAGIANVPIPLPSESNCISTLENAARPTTQDEQHQIMIKMGFNYRQVIGEVIYPMMKCHPDIAFHATKLSQCMENPGEAHFMALRQLCQCLAATMKDGIYYWKDTPRKDLPELQNPTTYHDNNTLEVNAAVQ